MAHLMGLADGHRLLTDRFHQNQGPLFEQCCSLSSILSERGQILITYLMGLTSDGKYQLYNSLPEHAVQMTCWVYSLSFQKEGRS